MTMQTTMNALAANLIYYGTLALALAMQIIAAVAIYRDAKVYGRDDAMLFAVLTGIFGSIPAVVYLAVRGKHKGVAVCPTCSAQYGNIDITKPNILMCSQCGSQLQLYTAQLTEEQVLASHKADKINKTLMAIGIIYWILAPILMTAYLYLSFATTYAAMNMY